MPQLVQTKRLGEDIDILPIRQNILKFDFTKKDTLTNKMVVHLNVLGPGMEDVRQSKAEGQVGRQNRICRNIK